MRDLHREVIQGKRFSFQVLGRANALRIAPVVPHLVISISEPRAPLAYCPGPRRRVGILRLSFHDASMEFPGRLMFSEEDARSIVAFVGQNLEETRLIICQCEGGRSRSAAVAAALAKWLEEEDAAFFRYYQPNRLVYSRLLEVCAGLPGGDGPGHPIDILEHRAPK